MNKYERRRKTETKPRPAEHNSMKDIRDAVNKAHTRLVGEINPRKWGNRTGKYNDELSRRTTQQP